MRSSNWVARGAAAATLLSLMGCGGAKSPTTCPAGTVLKGSDCVADDATSDTSSLPSSSTSTPASSSSSSNAAPSSGSSPSSSNDSSASSGASTSSSDSSGKTPYDKDAVESQLKRAARQVKGNCGGATDDSGQATGPWGATKATVVLGRNGHVKQVTVPAPYDGKPVGLCVVHAFEKIQFPPYAGSSDVSVDWDVDIAHPKK